MSRVAVVGAGISGLTAAYLLSRAHEVDLFDQHDRLGGHTHTHRVQEGGQELALDSGFLVHNERTYPNLVRLFGELGVELQDSDMSFSVFCPRTGFEYSSRGAAGFFADPRNLVRPRHYRLLAEVVRFNRVAPVLLNQPATDRVTVDEFVTSHAFSEAFVSGYLVPMTSAIWSATPERVRQFPAAMVVRFMHNHGMLSVGRHPTWRVVRGGAATYIPKLTAPISGRVRSGALVTRVQRHADVVHVVVKGQQALTYDHVVLACHGDEVLPLLADPTLGEEMVFKNFRTTRNETVLHTDTSFLPRRARARASWNFELGDESTAPTVTYHLNRLQQLRAVRDYCVTLNPRRPVARRAVIAQMVYTHPLYSVGAMAAQERWAEVSGRHRTHYCGAYWHNGFHEDGVRSAVRVADALGVRW